MSEELNLLQKLAKIQDMSNAVVKSKKGYGYTYADITDILANVTAGEAKYGVSLIPSIVHGSEHVEQLSTTVTKFDKTGARYDNTSVEMLVHAQMNFRWVNNDNPQEYIDVPWFIVGAQSDPSQAFGSALTYSTRYFLLQYFQIGQMDTDVDEYRSKQKEAEASEDRARAAEIIAEADKVIRLYLSDHPERSDDVARFASRFAKKGNYLSIKEPSLASKLLSDFKTTFLDQNTD